jgi:hypothetical protein
MYGMEWVDKDIDFDSSTVGHIRMRGRVSSKGKERKKKKKGI